MHGLMQHEQLTLTGILDRAERLHPTRRIVTRVADGLHHGDVRRVRRARPPARVGAARARRRPGRPRRHVRLELLAPPGAVLRRSVHGRGPAHANPRLHPDQVADIARRGGARLAFVDAALAPAFEPVAAASPASRRADAGRRGGRASGRARLRDAARRRIGGPRLARARRARRVPLCYTSGTTGRPEGRPVLAPRAGAARADEQPGRGARPDVAGRRPARGPDVPRERVGLPVRRDAGRRRAGVHGPLQRRPARRRGPHRDESA